MKSHPSAPAVLHVGLFVLFATILSGCINLFPNADERAESEERSAISIDPLVSTKKRIFVAKFINRSRQGGEDIAQASTNTVKDFLANHPDLVVVPPEEMGGTERFINEFNEYNLPLIYQRSRDHNVNGIIIGTIQDLSIRESGDDTGIFRSRDFAVTAILNVSVLDVSTQRELVSKLTSAEVTEQHMDFFNNRDIATYDPERGKVAVEKALEKVKVLLPDYSRKVAWTGKIAKVDLQRYFINAGETSGIARGQLLKVFEEPQPIFDPESKALLGVAPGRFKGLLKVIDHFGIDGSIAVVQSGGNFKEKDRVEIFTSIQN